MVKSYSKNANHNMRRPVVNKDIVDYMRTHLQENTGHLAELEVFARKENIPIIQPENPRGRHSYRFFSPSYGRTCTECSDYNR